jgi:hypothetical protein
MAGGECATGEILNGDDMTEESIRKDAAEALRRLLDAEERGELDAPGSQGARLLRRMEGAAAGLEATAPTDGRATNLLETTMGPASETESVPPNDEGSETSQ